MIVGQASNNAVVGQTLRQPSWHAAAPAACNTSSTPGPKRCLISRGTPAPQFRAASQLQAPLTFRSCQSAASFETFSTPAPSPSEEVSLEAQGGSLHEEHLDKIREFLALEVVDELQGMKKATEECRQRLKATILKPNSSANENDEQVIVMTQDRLREEALQREEAKILKQISWAREEDEQEDKNEDDVDGQVTEASEVVQLAELTEAVPKSHAISVDDKVALWSMRLQGDTMDEDFDNASDDNADAASILRSVVSIAPVAKSEVLEVLTMMENLERRLALEQQSKAEMVEHFENLFQELSSNHARDVSALEQKLAEEKLRNAQLVEVKLGMEDSHSRDIAVLEGMVQRALEENDRLASDVKTLKATASRRRALNGTDDSTSSGDVSTSSGDESGVATPDIVVRLPAKNEDVSSGDESSGASPEFLARMPAHKEAPDDEIGEEPLDPIVSDFLEKVPAWVRNVH